MAFHPTHVSLPTHVVLMRVCDDDDDVNPCEQHHTMLQCAVLLCLCGTQAPPAGRCAPHVCVCVFIDLFSSITLARVILVIAPVCVFFVPPLLHNFYTSVVETVLHVQGFQPVLLLGLLWWLCGCVAAAVLLRLCDDARW